MTCPAGWRHDVGQNRCIKCPKSAIAHEKNRIQCGISTHWHRQDVVTSDKPAADATPTATLQPHSAGSVASLHTTTAISTDSGTFFIVGIVTLVIVVVAVLALIISIALYLRKSKRRRRAEDEDDGASVPMNNRGSPDTDQENDQPPHAASSATSTEQPQHLSPASSTTSTEQPPHLSPASSTTSTEQPPHLSQASSTTSTEQPPHLSQASSTTPSMSTKPRPTSEPRNCEGT